MLKLENRIEHSINDPEFAEWIVTNFTDGDFVDERNQGNSGFGCLCDLNYESEHPDANFYRLYLRWNDDPKTDRDRELNEWFQKLFDDFDPETIDAEDTEIHVYYCSKCHQWAVDERL